MTEDILTPFLDSAGITLYQGDCIETMRRMPEASVDAIVTDPPYGLEFMGKEWDAFAPKDRKNATVWDGRRQAQAGWEDDAKNRSGKGGGGPSYKSAHKGYKRCVGCGKRAFSGSPCKCAKPEWVIEHRQEAPSTMIGFQAFSEAWAREAYRILKPGGHLLAFAGTRTYHRMASGVEDAGFEIRDCIAWIYGSGFPKSLDVSKAIDKKRDDLAEIYEVTAWVRAARDAAGLSNRDIDVAFGANGMGRHWTDIPPNGKQPAVPTLEQVPQLLDVLGVNADDVPARIRRLLLDLNGRKGQPGEAWFEREVTDSAWRTPSNKPSFATQWGFGAKSDGHFDITVPATDAARKWQGWGTALKPAFEPIVVARKPLVGTVAQNVLEHGTGALNIDGCRIAGDTSGGVWHGSTRKRGYDGGWDSESKPNTEPHTQGRWPTNVALDDEAASVLDEQTGDVSYNPQGVFGKGRGDQRADTPAAFAVRRDGDGIFGYGDRGGPSRFFYTAKASRKDRNTNGANNTHPTVKPTKLMQWLITLVLPPGGVLLDPFAGSGSTGVAARNLDARCILIEREDEYVDIIRQRLDDQTLFVQD